jgi:Fe-S oxidoreductase
MIDRVRKGDFKGGLAVFARYVPFPAILARICDRPCEASCKRTEAGDPVRINALERACVDLGGSAPVRKRMAGVPRRIAISGGGLSGLTAAVELAAKGYEVTVFEPGPRLLDEIRGLCDDAVAADLAVLASLEVDIRLNAPMPDLDSTGEFDAVYLQAGVPIDPDTLATARPGVFAGGAHGASPVRAVQAGKCAAISIDRFLQGASLVAGREHLGPVPTRLYMNTGGIAPVAAIEPADPSGRYSKDEAVREAGRCFPCGCMECVKVCEYLAHYRSYPKRYVREIYNNDCIIMGAHPANLMVNSCTLCGLCAEVCPEKLNMGDVCLDARESLTAKGKMPPSAHEFALRDMAFSTSEAFTLVRHQPGFHSSAAVFFPGCQLSGSSPDHVFRTYQHLTRTIPGGVGLMLGCCGAPAHWAGRRDQFEEVLRPLREAWTGMDRPRLIAACSSCYRTLKDNLPEIPVDSLWNVMERSALPEAMRLPRTLALHDPCTTRGEPGIQDAARRLLTAMGVTIQELNRRDQMACCGFGGLARFANPEVTDKILKRRIAESDADFVTYCAMCRDSFARQGKRAWHILDLVLGADGADPAARPDPGFSSRQENRARLKSRFLREIWTEKMADQPAQVQLSVSPGVMALLELRMILLDDIRSVVHHAESTGAKLEDRATGHILASYRPACVTYWVEYSPGESGIVIHNAYSHRMQVE